MLSWIDVAVVVLVVGYAALGMRQGVIRRLAGLVAVYVGFAAATFVSPLAGSVIQQGFPGLAYTDARVYTYLAIFVVVTAGCEGLALAYRHQIEISFVALDRASGVVAGLGTALLAVAAVILLLDGAANPAVGNRDVMQIHLRQAVTSARLGGADEKLLGGPAFALFYPVYPHDPQSYFELAPATS